MELPLSLISLQNSTVNYYLGKKKRYSEAGYILEPHWFTEGCVTGINPLCSFHRYIHINSRLQKLA